MKNEQVSLRPVISTATRTSLIAALLCAVSLLLPNARAQQGEADRQALAQLRAKAETGDAHAQCELGTVFSLGRYGAATNYVEAIKWFRQAAAQNHADAQYHLGFCYDTGQGVVPDIAEAVKWYRQAAEQHHAGAQYNLGSCYALGEGVAQNAVEAVKWCRQAAEQNHTDAQDRLGTLYTTGQGVATSYVEAVKWFRRAAEQHHAMAQNHLGFCYATGQGVAKDHVEAVKWYRKGADQNLAEAQYNLGGCYATGQGVATNYVEAVKWYRTAAEQNYAKAQNLLGGCYATGQGVAKDYLEAYKWYLLAAAQGDELAKTVTAKLEAQLTRAQIAEGQKLADDFKPSEIPPFLAPPSVADGNPLADLRAKAATGDAQAQNELGEAFYVGKRGVSRNPVEAVKWFRQAANQNHPVAQSNLGVCYERGDGVPKYEVVAYKWYLLAAAQGDNKAKRNASMLELMLSQDQIAEGKKRAQDWLEQRRVPGALHD